MKERRKPEQLIEKAESRATALRVEARKMAEELVDHAKDEARQMLLTANLDITQIPLICKRIDSIQLDVESIKVDMGWVKKLVTGMVAGIGTMIVGILIYSLTHK